MKWSFSFKHQAQAFTRVDPEGFAAASKEMLQSQKKKYRLGSRMTWAAVLGLCTHALSGSNHPSSPYYLPIVITLGGLAIGGIVLNKCDDSNEKRRIELLKQAKLARKFGMTAQGVTEDAEYEIVSDTPQPKQDAPRLIG